MSGAPNRTVAEAQSEAPFHNLMRAVLRRDAARVELQNAQRDLDQAMQAMKRVGLDVKENRAA